MTLLSNKYRYITIWYASLSVEKTVIILISEVIFFLKMQKNFWYCTMNVILNIVCHKTFIMMHSLVRASQVAQW